MAKTIDEFRGYSPRMNDHIDQCVEAGWNDDELYDALNVALIVGGSIVIPHLQHAFDTIDQLRAEGGRRP